jgi:hypothetical protein
MGSMKTLKDLFLKTETCGYTRGIPAGLAGELLPLVLPHYFPDIFDRYIVHTSGVRSFLASLQKNFAYRVNACKF